MALADVGSALAEAPYAVEDLVRALGPDEGARVGVGGLDVAADRRLQGLDGGERPAPDLAQGEQGEPALDQVEPGGRGRREVQVVARPLGQPVPD